MYERHRPERRLVQCGAQPQSHRIHVGQCGGHPDDLQVSEIVLVKHLCALDVPRILDVLVLDTISPARSLVQL